MGLSFESRFVCLLFYIFCLHAAAIFFFTRGFLLTRTELAVHSRCADVAAARCGEVSRWGQARADHFKSVNESGDVKEISHEASAGDNRGSDRQTSECWTRPAVKRVVILILDALRFDFVAPSSLLIAEPQPWMDKLQVLQRLAMEENSSAQIFKFIADPPTTSLQRLKGLTTGSLPTFIDVGRSFGAPAILEDNLIQQLVSNGKRVLMMGDDTWSLVFPDHFTEAHPFPSYNVKDLHTVDDGVIEHLFPALHRDDWDVLIGHFLGADHVGHIFGVESPFMVKKLEQYNRVIEEVISVLHNYSEPEGLHDNTLLLVMGDHGQTLNGDHGGGTAEEVETILFAMSTKHQPASTPSCVKPSSYKEKKGELYISTFPQLDFAVTLAALIGVPFPFASIGRVNPELFALTGGSWPSASSKFVAENKYEWQSLEWIKYYHDVLCINSWQVNRYLELYSESSFSGFPPIDFSNMQSLYAYAQSLAEDYSLEKLPVKDTESSLNVHEEMATLSDRIGAFSSYLEAAAGLARSQWTQFSNGLMAFGLLLMIASFAVLLKGFRRAVSYGESRLAYIEDSEGLFPVKHMIKGGFVIAVTAVVALIIMFTISPTERGATFGIGASSIVNRVGSTVFGAFILGSAVAYLEPAKSVSGWKSELVKANAKREWIFGELDLRAVMAALFVAMHACSLLSNSYILSEGRVVSFILASLGILDLRRSVQEKSKVLQAVCFLGLNCVLSYFSHMNFLKDTEALVETASFDATNVHINEEQPLVWHLVYTWMTSFPPVCILGVLMIRRLRRSSLRKNSGYWIIYIGVPFTYTCIFLHWLLEDLTATQVLVPPKDLREFARLQLPRIVYSFVAVQIGLLIFSMGSIDGKHRKFKSKEVLQDTALSLLAVCSGLIILLLGRQGPLIALLVVIEGWCLADLVSLGVLSEGNQGSQDLGMIHPASIVQWSFVAVQLFFCTGHKCTFDGLRYAAAFVGFDHFNFYRQGALLAIDTFGASHLLPILALPLFVPGKQSIRPERLGNKYFVWKIYQAFLLYGIVSATTTFFTTLCVTIHRRHLMVWGLFAPKFVFDAIGLLVTDALLALTASFYLLPFLIH